MLNEDDSQQLLEFGLTPNQAKTYLATIQLGVATINQIAQTAKIRREAVYRVLSKLETIGLLERILGNPMRVKAISIENALTILIQQEHDRIQQRLTQLQSQKEQIVKNFTVTPITLSLREPHFSLITGREAVMSKAIQMVGEATNTIDLISSRDSCHHFFGNYRHVVKNTLQNGVPIRLLLNATEHSEALLGMIQQFNDDLTPITVRYTEHPHNHYLIKDYDEALFATSINVATGRNPYLWTNDPNLIEIFQRYYEKLWHASLRVDSIQTASPEKRMQQLLHELQPSNHALFLYSDFDAKYNVLFTFLSLGLEQGDAAIYIATEESGQQIRDAMRRWGLDVDTYEQTGALQIFEYEESIYNIETPFHGGRIIQNLKQLYYDTIAHGFASCRIVGEMACFFHKNMVGEMLDYERALHRILDLPLIGVCALNSQLLNRLDNSLQMYNELLKAHGVLLCMGANNTLGKIDIQHTS
jgi:sugar-specific transcriptional regulator TrmB